jgi:predicted site-specific integrase-resolvase
MTPQQVRKHYGSEIKAAAGIGVSVTTIRNWLAAGKIPKLKQLAIQTLTNNKLKADDAPQ